MVFFFQDFSFYRCIGKLNFFSLGCHTTMRMSFYFSILKKEWKNQEMLGHPWRTPNHLPLLEVLRWTKDWHEKKITKKKKRIWIGWLVYDCHYSRVCGVGEINKTQVASKQEMTLELDGCFKATTRISFFHNFNLNLLRSAI